MESFSKKSRRSKSDVSIPSFNYLQPNRKRAVDLIINGFAKATKRGVKEQKDRQLKRDRYLNDWLED